MPINYFFVLYASNEVSTKDFLDMFTIFKLNMAYLYEIETSDFEIWKQNIILSNGKTFLIFLDESLLAFLNYNLINSSIYISEVQVLKSFQNKGLLKMLLKLILENNSQCDQVIVHINSKNQQSKNVFIRLGFIKVSNIEYVLKLYKG